MKPDVSGLVAEATTRRGFVARIGAALLGVGAAAAAQAEDADAFHFCGHIYTTGSCPHPTGIPRIDSRGYPLRARDGAPVDDLGRVVDRRGFPVDARGRRLTDAKGRPLAPAPRSRVCLDAIPARYGHKVVVDGSWYRCCGGKVRELSDCCGRMRNRINGDAALTGYCSAGRKVFCVMYHDTGVPC